MENQWYRKEGRSTAEECEEEGRERYVDVAFGGLPRFFLIGGSPVSPPSSAVSGLGFLGGRPRLRLTGGSSPESSAFFS